MDVSKNKNRIVGIIDIDAFELQIYLNSVYQKWKHLYKTYSMILADATTERIISINSIAKQHNITREDSVEGAKTKCPDVMVMRKEMRFNKPETLRSRQSSYAVLDCIKKYRDAKQSNMTLECSHLDEFCLDLTEEVDRRMKLRLTADEIAFGSIHLEYGTKYSEDQISGWYEIYGNGKRMDSEKCTQDLRLFYGAMILTEVRNEIFQTTSLESSGGVAVNKLLAKLAVPLNRPIATTALNREGFSRISQFTSIHELTGLGRGIGEQIATAVNGNNIMTIKELQGLSALDLHNKFGIKHNQACMAVERAAGIYNEDVVEKLMTYGIRVSKARYKNPELFIGDHQAVKAALGDLCDDLAERIQEDMDRHRRLAETVRVQFDLDDEKNTKRGFTIGLQYSGSPLYLHKTALCSDLFCKFREDLGGLNGKVAQISLSIQPKTLF